jgi:hypothetical protein
VADRLQQLRSSGAVGGREALGGTKHSICWQGSSGGFGRNRGGKAEDEDGRGLTVSAQDGTQGSSAQPVNGWRGVSIMCWGPPHLHLPPEPLLPLLVHCKQQLHGNQGALQGPHSRACRRSGYEQPGGLLAAGQALPGVEAPS